MSDRAHGSIETGDGLGGVQVGDTIVVITEREDLRRVIVTSAGPVWVTALGTRFRRDNGQAASKYSRPCAMTVAENDRREETRRVLLTLRSWGLGRTTTAVRELTLGQLREVAALLDRFEAAEENWRVTTAWSKWFKGMDLGDGLRWTAEPFGAGWEARTAPESFNEAAAAYRHPAGFDATWTAEAFEAGWLARGRSS